MKIVVDLQGIQNDSRYRGIGRYSIAFVKALIRHSRDHEIVILLSDLFPESLKEVRDSLVEEAKVCAIEVWPGIGPTAYLNKENHWRREVSELLRENYLARLKPDVVLVSSVVEGGVDNAIISIGKMTNIFTAAILYDLIPWVYKNEYLPDPNALAWYEERMRTLTKANLLFAISESSRLEGIQHLGVDATKVVNISAAIGNEFSTTPLSAEAEQLLRSSFVITKPFLMYSGAFDPRKNIDRLLEAFASLPKDIKQAHQLVLAGGLNAEQRAKIKLQMRKVKLSEADVIITGRISDADFRGLYRLCQAYILPTYHEGFGLTALEAMACGAPTIGSNVSSVPEVIGLEQALFDPFSVKDIAKKIALALTDAEFRAELLAHNPIQLAKFSWDQTARRALDTLEELSQQGAIGTDHKAYDPVEQTNDLIKRIAEIEGTAARAPLELKLLSALIAQTQPKKDPRPTLFIDITELHQRDSKTGIQRVVRSIIHHLLPLTNGSHQVELVYATENQPYRSATAFTKRSTQAHDAVMTSEASDDLCIDPRPGDIFLGLDFQDVVATNHGDFYDYLRTLGVKVYFVLYDLLPLQLKTTFSSEVIENYTKWLHLVAQQDGVICISQSVADEFRTWLTENYPQLPAQFKVDWFHLGGDIESSRPTKGLPFNGQEALNLIEKGTTFLAVGTIEPRKCHAQILAAFDLLWEQGEDVCLVIVGKQGWLTEQIATRITIHPRYGSSLFWYEVVSDEFLAKIYQHSTCLLAASEAEGFGLPLIEAAQYGLQVIARDIPVFHEVAQDGAFYFSGKTPLDLAGAIQEWLRLRHQGVAPDSRLIKWQSWKQSSAQLISRIIPEFLSK